MRARTGLAAFAAAVLIGLSAAVAQPVDDEAEAMEFLEEQAEAPPACDPAVDACSPPNSCDGSLIYLESAPGIEAPFGNAVLGAADGDVTLVVFADYACPACREAQPVIDALIARDPKLRVVYRLLINEDEGREAALISLAVARSGGGWSKFHHAMDAGGQPTSASIAAALASSGIDRASLPDMTEPNGDNIAIFDEVSNNSFLIGQRNAKAIPAWVIGDGDALNGFEVETLEAAIAAARAEKASVR